MRKNDQVTRLFAFALLRRRYVGLRPVRTQRNNIPFLIKCIAKLRLFATAALRIFRSPLRSRGETKSS